MDDLTYVLRQLCRRNKDGSHATQGDRLGGLTLVARQLGEAGFRRMSPSSLKGKHVAALVERWQAEGLSAGTVKNRLAHVRWRAFGAVADAGAAHHDAQARQAISRELGHERTQITAVYLGR